MKRTLKIISFLITFFLILSPISLAGQFTVTRIYDGNTIKAKGHDIEIKVRLVGIGAPEISRKKSQPGQSYSQQAKKFLADLVLDKVVEIKEYGLDRYNRVLGVIYLYARNINLQMVRVGLAEVCRGKPPKGFDLTPYRDAEKEARAAKRGIWSLGDNYISPKEGRRMQRGK
ncbi:MAG: thermonuclease family protein [Candidatus Hodarchaeota archaeon]